MPASATVRLLALALAALTGCERSGDHAAVARPVSEVRPAAAVADERPAADPAATPDAAAEIQSIMDDAAWGTRLETVADQAMDAMTAFEARWLERIERDAQQVIVTIADARGHWLGVIDDDADLHASVTDLRSAAETSGLAEFVGRLIAAEDDLAEQIGEDLDVLRADQSATMQDHRAALRAEYDVLAATIGALAPEIDGTLTARQADRLRETWVATQEHRSAVHRRLIERLEDADQSIAVEVEIARHELWRHLTDTRRAALDDIQVP